MHGDHRHPPSDGERRHGQRPSSGPSAPASQYPSSGPRRERTRSRPSAGDYQPHRHTEPMDDAGILPETDAGAVPVSAPRGRGGARPSGPRGGRRFAPVTLAVMLAGLLLALSGALELAGAMPWPFDASPIVAVQEVLPTPTPSPTPTPTPTPKPSPTAVPAQPVYIPPAGSYSLGCGTPGPKALDFVVRAGTATHGVALTFDDGPSPDYTANILSTLEQTHTPATFFVVGSNAAKYPDLIAREAKDGAVAMHTYDHPYMTRISPESRAWELTATLQAVHAALGPNYCVQFWRPPFGDYNADVLTLTHAMGLTTVTWNVDPEDWSSPGVQVIVDRVLAAAQPGSIILLHDGYFGRWQTAQALPQIIKGLRAKGFTLVTVPQLLAGGQ